MGTDCDGGRPRDSRSGVLDLDGCSPTRRDCTSHWKHGDRGVDASSSVSAESLPYQKLDIYISVVAMSKVEVCSLEEPPWAPTEGAFS